MAGRDVEHDFRSHQDESGFTEDDVATLKSMAREKRRRDENRAKLIQAMKTAGICLGVVLALKVLIFDLWGLVAKLR